MTTEIKSYLNSLSEDILIIIISGKGIKSLPDLTRFKNLEELYCSNNELTSLPTLPQNLQKLSCSNNQLISLPTLPQNLEILSCYSNKLTSLPTLPQNLQKLYCDSNKLTSLPTLPQNLKFLNCYNNQLTLLPTLPQNLEYLSCSGNPVYEIVNSISLFQIKQNIQILNKFRHLYYCFKFKKQLRKWLWVKVREPNIKKIYNPKYLIENLGDEDDDLDTVLNNWK
jgi:Leucine-rich repeat (LRR) protein